MRRWRGRRVAWARRRKLREIADFFRVGGGDAWMNGSQFAGKSLSAFFRFCVLIGGVRGERYRRGAFVAGAEVGMPHSQQALGERRATGQALARGGPRLTRGERGGRGRRGYSESGEMEGEGRLHRDFLRGWAMGWREGKWGGGAISHICSNSSIARRCRERKGELTPNTPPRVGTPSSPRGKGPWGAAGVPGGEGVRRGEGIVRACAGVRREGARNG